MNPIFNNLAHETLLTIDDWLTNLDEATTEDLTQDFIDLGLTTEQANAALALRTKYLIKTFKSGHSPLFKGDNTISFNPHTMRFENDL
jgi:hypothetical protein